MKINTDKGFKSVEQRTENPCVAGSIPAHTTIIGSEKSEPFLCLYSFPSSTRRRNKHFKSLSPSYCKCSK